MRAELPPEIPVMTLPNTVFFPGTVVPLHIFEPRYRMMLADVLASHRIFAVAALDVDRVSLPDAPEPPREVATAGFIRACQKASNGTSDLILEGLARVRILGIVRETPYRLIRIAALEPPPVEDPDRLRLLRAQLMRSIRLRVKLGKPLPPRLDALMRGIEDPAGFCDLVVYALVEDPGFKQRMLETADPELRLRLTIERFHREAAQLRLQRRLQSGLDDDQIGTN